ncbi:hypothetical protein LZP73_06490 [Shewanella sp. AS16]|uniref:hypothetical protein n=1 Tax=Shewanella sp. AS16 TaxID=2907625 RepID=UPI001F4103E2|nr:hypothetical protein [Shewanella sp. AS16]MCE9685865.1 hypothetical protein [Shewanella sp. AS16]
MIPVPARLALLMFLYCLLTAGALWRALGTGALDVFTLGVVPVLLGLILRQSWACMALRLYVGIQTLGCAALAITALIAYRITPEEVRVVVQGQELPIPAVVIGLMALLGFQYWVAFSANTRNYLARH